MILSEYVTGPRTGTVHLVPGDVDPTLPSRTRCGRDVTDAWQRGDETPSGFLATCETCLRRHRRAVADFAELGLR